MVYTSHAKKFLPKRGIYRGDKKMTCEKNLTSHFMQKIYQLVFLMVFLFHGSKRQITRRKTEHQQPVTKHQSRNRKLNPGWGVGIENDIGCEWVIGDRSNQAGKVVIPAGKNSRKDRDGRDSHQQAEVADLLRPQ